MDLIELLNKYFTETPREKILEDWEKSSKYDSIGPTVEEFIKQTEYLQSLYKTPEITNERRKTIDETEG